LATAAALVSCNFRVALLARSKADLTRQAVALGPLAHPIVVDVTDEAQLGGAISQIDALIGLPDVLVNAAGTFKLARIGQVLPTEFVSTLDANLIAPFRLLNAYVPRMRERRSGHIVTVGSIADHVAYPENGAYAASKYGVRAVHEVLRQELRGSGVRASLVSPGPVDTAMWDEIDPDNRSDLPHRDQMLRPEDVAEAIRWLVSQPAHVNVDELRLTRQ
jgi:NADP-dependent 3-hydroxy acid dehydrogenase YdfG